MPTPGTMTTQAYHRGSDLLALGFGTTVAMWAIGYICRFPGMSTPAWLLMALLMACLLGGGFLTARLTARGPMGGLQVGLLVGLLNILVLGSLLAGTDSPNQVVPAAVWWLPGSLLVGGGLGTLGALAGRGKFGNLLVNNGLPGFTFVAAAATFLLLVVGGIVTGNQAGLAVTDWPNSYGYNMFLYPLSRMTGGIYYEHVHRLLGSLVGLTTLVLAVHLLVTEPRAWIKRLGLAALALVIIQGILGGLRVTGFFTASQDPSVVQPNLWLAVIHGVTGQVFFGTMVALAVFTTRGWQEATASRPGALERKLSTMLLVVLLIQLTLGSLLRHTDMALHAHITGAVIALGLGVFMGSRLILKHADEPILKRLGHGMLHGLALQLILGFVALYARNLTTVDGGPHAADVIITTIHQALGALLLATAVLAVIWTRRLLRP